MLEGAVLYCAGSPKTIAEAFDGVLTNVGYKFSTEAAAADLELSVHAGARGVAFAGELGKTLALALARRLARGLRQPVVVLTARLSKEGPGDTFECEVDDLTVLPDGASKPGRWAQDTIAAYASDWGQACDGKAYFAVSSLLEDARETVLPESEPRPPVRLCAPASLGSARLDEIAKQVRLADRSTFASIGGRCCVRITTAGTTVTSFLEPPEVDALRRALAVVEGTP